MSPKRRHQQDVDETDNNPKRLTAQQTYFLAAVQGRRPDLMKKHLMDNRLQGMRQGDNKGRQKWCPNTHTQDYQNPETARLNPQVELYSDVLGLKKQREQTVL
jgi:hypothetical protein